jgi:hypothetical protein
MTRGSLTIVGTGIRLSQISTEARSAIESADKLLFLVNDPVTYAWLTAANPSAESLHNCYIHDRPRLTTYVEMVERILSYVREGFDVCVAFYGHPGVFSYPTHEAIHRARADGYQATMLPGISAEDCLFADLGIDPGTRGCQSFEATDFLILRRRFDPCVPLILWQIAVTGELDFTTECSVSGLRILIEVLLQHYGPTHEAIIYEAAQFFSGKPKIQRVPLEGVVEAEVTASSTLYLAPKAPADPDHAMAERLGITLLTSVA